MGQPNSLNLPRYGPGILMIEISHQQARYLIRQGLDGRRLPDEQWASLQLHLDSCAECRQYRDRLGSVERGLTRTLRGHLDASWRELPSGEAQKITERILRSRNIKKRLRKVYLYGFLAALGLALIIFIRPALNLINPRPTQGVLPAQAVAAVTPTPADISFRGLIAFAGPSVEEGNGGNQEIYLLNPGVRLGEGELINLTQHLANDTAPAWSPDGEWVAFLSDRAVLADGSPHVEVYVMHVSGSRLTRLTDNPDVTWNGPLSWSVDGAWIALTGQRGEDRYIYLAPTNSQLLGQNGARPLAFTRGAAGPALFSDKSNKLVYGSTSGSRQGLTLFDITSGRYLPLTRVDTDEDSMTAGVNGEFDWSSDGERLVYLAEGVQNQAGTILPSRDPYTSLRLTYGLDIPLSTYPVSKANEELDNQAGVGNTRGLVSIPGENERAALYLRDDSGGGCWTIHIRAPMIGFFETENIPGLCVEGSLRRANWSAGIGDSAPRLVVTGRLAGGDRSLALYSVRLADPGSDEEAQIERLADLPFKLAEGEAPPELYVRPQGRGQMSIAPDDVPAYVPPYEPVQPPSDLNGILAFSVDRDENSLVFASDPRGSQLRMLTSGNGVNRCPAWSPDGSRIAYLSDLDTDTPGSNEIYLMDEYGLRVQRLTSPESGVPVSDAERLAPYYDCPAWSPDGKMLASVYHASTGDYLTVAPVDGSEPFFVRIRAVSPTAGLAWSADASYLAFATQIDREVNLMALEVASLQDGSAKFLNLLDTRSIDVMYGLAFTADGLAYISDTSGANTGNLLSLRWVTLDGSAPREGIDLPAARLVAPVGRRHLFFHPDGRLSLLVHGPAEGELKTQVVLVDPASDEVMVAASLADIVYDADWSPDGSWLALASENGLYVVNAQIARQGDAAPLSIYGGRPTSIDWQP